MENEFASPRWHGRVLGLLVGIARKRRLTFLATQQNITLLDLYVRVLSVSNDDDQATINALMKKLSDTSQNESDNGIEIPESTANDLDDKGFKEAKIVIIRNLPITSLLNENNSILEGEMIREAEERKKMAKEEKMRQKRNRIVWACIGAVILAVIIYNLPFFKEMRFYNEVMKIRTTRYCHQYYGLYPDGRHYEDVMNLELELAENGAGDKPVAVLTRYLHKFPDGKYAPQFNTKCDSLWDIEIAKYQQRDKSHESPEAVNYMTEMLAYMKAHRVNSVNLKINPSINLKDYDEYDASSKTLLRMLFLMEKENLDTTMILSLKENFTQQDRSILIDILAEGVEKSFVRMFSPDFVAVNKNSSDFNETSPDLNFNYEIKNQEIEIQDSRLPDIWTYSSKDLMTGISTIKGYILGIDVKFDVKFTIPGSSTTYTYSELGEPGKEFSNIDGIRDGYRRMTQMCFAKFSNKMSDNLGLEETYFRGDEEEEEE